MDASIPYIVVYGILIVTALYRVAHYFFVKSCKDAGPLIEAKVYFNKRRSR